MDEQMGPFLAELYCMVACHSHQRPSSHPFFKKYVLGCISLFVTQFLSHMQEMAQPPQGPSLGLRLHAGLDDSSGLPLKQKV